ncbi:hypothetical protein F4802DRAFT_564409 [Xylaria palmicola]|nr:hypothetical protein F4802DRAFT_564409 [Xylaria palmicola]
MEEHSQSQVGQLAEQPTLDAKSEAEFESSSATMARVSSPMAITFTPINRQGPVPTQDNEHAHVPLHTMSTAMGIAHSDRKRKAGRNYTPVGKRSRTTDNSRYPTSTKQPPLATVQAFKVTKPMNSIHGGAYNGIYDIEPPISGQSFNRRCGAEVQGSTTTIEQLTTHPPSPRVPRRYSCDHLTRQSTADRFSKPVFRVGTLTLENTVENEQSPDSIPAVASSDCIAPYNTRTAPSADVTAIRSKAASDDRSDSIDAYLLDDDIADDDFIQLCADHSGFVQESHIPPSSVQGWDHESRSAAEFDPSLKCSPPDAGENGLDPRDIDCPSASGQTDAFEDLLDEGVDWNTVLANLSTTQDDSSLSPYPKTALAGNEISDTSPALDEAGPLTAFVRPPFPGKVRDRPLIPGMSSTTLLRTCFRTGLMISETARCHNHQQDVVFELYAVVTYSSRETLVRKQHFQFADLYKDRQPYPAATLTDWRTGSQLDKDSSTFLDTREGPRLCWCMCKPMRDLKAAIGWTYTVLRIKEVDHEQIQWAKRIICGDSAESPADTVTGDV